MTGPVPRYWAGLSPALRRHHRASLLPSVLFLALAFTRTVGVVGLRLLGSYALIRAVLHRRYQ